jgi:nucleoid DNA-binding protein
VGVIFPKKNKKKESSGMKRSDLIEEYGKQFGVAKKEAEERIEWLEERIIKGVKSGDEVIFSFGKFTMKKVPARTITIQMGADKGKQKKVPAKVKPVFKPAKKFKDALS